MNDHFRADDERLASQDPAEAALDAAKHRLIHAPAAASEHSPSNGKANDAEPHEARQSDLGQYAGLAFAAGVLLGLSPRLRRIAWRLVKVLVR